MRLSKIPARHRFVACLCEPHAATAVAPALVACIAVLRFVSVPFRLDLAAPRDCAPAAAPPCPSRGPLFSFVFALSHPACALDSSNISSSAIKSLSHGGVAAAASKACSLQNISRMCEWPRLRLKGAKWLMGSSSDCCLKAAKAQWQTKTTKISTNATSIQSYISTRTHARTHAPKPTPTPTHTNN